MFCTPAELIKISTPSTSGREEGIEAGRAEGIAMVAKTMYAKGMDIETIASMTGMDKNELEKLLG